MINLTQSALAAISRFISSSESTIAGLRIQVSGGGCSGLQYSMKLEESAEETDQVLEFDDIHILIDPESAPLMEGVELDFVDSLEGSGFKFVNPNAASSCACGQSFSTC